MKKLILLSAVSVIALAGCKSKDPNAGMEKRYVDEEQAPKPRVVEKNGEYFIMMEEYERLCSDCDK